MYHTFVFEFTQRVEPFDQIGRSTFVGNFKSSALFKFFQIGRIRISKYKRPLPAVRILQSNKKYNLRHTFKLFGFSVFRDFTDGPNCCQFDSILVIENIAFENPCLVLILRKGSAKAETGDNEHYAGFDTCDD